MLAGCSSVNPISARWRHLAIVGSASQKRKQPKAAQGMKNSKKQYSAVPACCRTCRMGRSTRLGEGEGAWWPMLRAVPASNPSSYTSASHYDGTNFSHHQSVKNHQKISQVFNFIQLVLGCIKTNFSNPRLIVSTFSRALSLF